MKILFTSIRFLRNASVMLVVIDFLLSEWFLYALSHGPYVVEDSTLYHSSSMH